MYLKQREKFHTILKISSAYLDYNIINTPPPPLDNVQIEKVLS